MKKIKKTLYLLLCIVLVFSQMGAAGFAESDASEAETVSAAQAVRLSEVVGEDADYIYEANDTFAVESEDDWKAFSTLIEGYKDFAGKTVILTKDITVTAPIKKGVDGDYNYYCFSGTFDGQGNTITMHLSWSLPESDENMSAYGLFTEVGKFGETTCIKNLVLGGEVNVSREGADEPYEAVGGLVGSNYGELYIENVINRVNIHADQVFAIAGFVGYVGSKTVITKCASLGYIQSKFAAAAGYLYTADNVVMTIDSSYQSGTLTAAASSAFISGDGSKAQVKACYSTSGQGYINEQIPEGNYVPQQDNLYEGVWKMNQAAGSPVWAVNTEETAPTYFSEDSNAVYRIHLQRLSADTKYEDIAVSALDGGNSEQNVKYKSHDGRDFYGYSDMALELELKGNDFEEEKNNLIVVKINPLAQGTVIREADKEAGGNKVICKVTASGGNAEVQYGIQQEWNDVPNTVWYDSDAAEFVLSTYGELAGFMSLVNDGNTFRNKTVKLGKDITIPADSDFKPIGNHVKKPFSGTFDGQGHSISGLNMTVASNGSSYYGLFGNLDKAVIKDLTVKYGSIKSDKNTTKYVGGIAGYALDSSISGCVNELNIAVTGNWSEYTGGIVGQAEGGQILNCANYGKISGVRSVGGIAGGCSGKITSSLSYAEDMSLNLVGTGGAKVRGSYSLGQTAAEYFAGKEIVSRMNEAAGEDFWGYNWEGKADYKYPIFADMGQNPVYYIAVKAAAADTAAKLEITKSGTDDTASPYYGNQDLTVTLNGDENTSFMVVRNSGGYLAANDLTVKVKNQDGSAENVVVVYGTKEELECEEITEWYSEGVKTFTIFTAGQLKGMATLVNDGYTFEGQTVELANDIDLSSVCGEDKPWKPIGWRTTVLEHRYFKGTFEENHHTIKNLYAKFGGAVNEENNGIGNTLGLFGAANGATIKNLSVEGDVIWEAKGTNTYVGGLLGVNQEGVLILENINCDVNIKSNARYTGGVIGSVWQGNTIENANPMFEGSRLVNVGNIACTTGSSESNYTGGLIGQLVGGFQGEGNLTESYNTGEVKNSAVNGYAGGLVGYYQPGYTYTGPYYNITDIYNCYNAGDVYGDIAAGMIAAVEPKGTENTAPVVQPVVQNLYNSGAVYGITKAYAAINDKKQVVTAGWGVVEVGTVIIHPIADAAKNLFFDKNKIFKCASFSAENIAAATAADTYEENDITADAITADEFASGRVAYLLDNGGTNLKRAGVWGQSREDEVPVFQSLRSPSVYKLTWADGSGGSTENTINTVSVLSNTKNAADETEYYFNNTAATANMAFKTTAETGKLLDRIHAYKGSDGSEIPVNITEEKPNQAGITEYFMYVEIPMGEDVRVEAAFCETPKNMGQEMTLRLNANGGSWNGKDQADIKSVAATVGTRYKEIAELQNPDVSYGEYDFTGWYYDKACTQPVDMTTMIEAEDADAAEPVRNLYAGWDTNAVRYRITLNSCGGSFPEGTAVTEDGKVVFTAKKGSIVSLNSYIPQKEGAAFIGWFYDEALHLPYTDAAINSDITLYAGWQQNEGGSGGSGVATWYVKFDANGGYFSSGSQKASVYQISVKNNASITLEELGVPQPARDMADGKGFVFQGWYLSPDASVPEAEWTGEAAVTKDITVYAHWKSGVDFEEILANGGNSENAPIIISDYETLQAFRDYVNKGNTCSGKYFALGADIEVKADWRSINNFAGILDGRYNRIIYNDAAASLFDAVSGTVKNLRIDGTGNVSGGVAARLESGAVIDNCRVMSTAVLNGADIGGIVGSVRMTGYKVYTITNCTIEDGASINGTGIYVGGIIGSVTGDPLGRVKIENCEVGRAKITGKGAGADSDGETTAAVGGLGGILGYGAASIVDCSSAAILEATGNAGYGIGGIVGALGTTQGTLNLNKVGFTGSITVNGEAGSIGGILGLRPNNTPYPTIGGPTVSINNAYSTGSIRVGSVRQGSHIGGILGNNFDRSDNSVEISNTYWNGSYTNASGSLDGFGAISGNSAGVTAANTYYRSGFDSTAGTAKDADFFASGEAAYELDNNGGNQRGTWTQGEDGPIFNRDGEDGIIYKVEVEGETDVEWPDGTKAKLTTTVTSERNKGLGIPPSDKAFVKKGEKIITEVTGIPDPKVVKNSDGSTTTTNYEVKIKDRGGDQLLYDSTNPTMDVSISKDLSTKATSEVSTKTTGKDSGQGGGSGGGSGSGNQPGQGDGNGGGDGQGDGQGSGNQDGDGTGQTGTKDDKPNGDKGTGTDVTPGITTKPTSVTPANQTTPPEISEEPSTVPTQTSNDGNADQNGTLENGGQSQGGGEQGEIKPESKIYKLIKSVANTIQENPIASAAIGIAVIGIILFGAWNRRRKEDAEKK